VNPCLHKGSQDLLVGKSIQNHSLGVVFVIWAEAYPKGCSFWIPDNNFFVANFFCARTTDDLFATHVAIRQCGHNWCSPYLVNVRTFDHFNKSYGAPPRALAHIFCVFLLLRFIEHFVARHKSHVPIARRSACNLRLTAWSILKTTPRYWNTTSYFQMLNCMLSSVGDQPTCTSSLSLRLPWRWL